MTLEFINKVEVQGKVFRVKYAEYPAGKKVTLTVRTSQVVYKGDDHFVDTVWHHISVWEDAVGAEKIEQIAALTSDDWVHVIGKTREYKAATPTGETTYREIVAYEITPFKGPIDNPRS